MYNAVIRALQLLGLADAFGATRVPIYCMNVAYPMIPEEIVEFCAGKKRVLVVEEGQPAFIEDAVQAALRRAGANEREGHRQGHAPAGGRIHGRSGLAGISQVPEPGKGNRCGKEPEGKGAAAARRGPGPAARLLRRLPGAPGVRGDEGRREATTGAFHVSADIGCHTVRHAAAVQHRPHGARLRPGARLELGGQHHVRQAHRHHHGRRRLLAQRPHLRHRQCRVQQGRRHPRHHEERLQLGHRHAGAALQPAAQRIQVRRHGDRARAAKASASAG